MIHYITQKCNDKLIPVSLEINDDLYIYQEDTLFDKLENYIGHEITVTYLGINKEETNSVIYIIDEIIYDDVTTLILGDIEI